MEYAICYISTANEVFQEKEIKDLLEKWKGRNGENNVKGILLYSEGHFFQVLEGEKQKILELYDLIKEDSRHKGVIQVLGKEVEKGSLDHYITDYLHDKNFARADLIRHYCESVKGMDNDVQIQIKAIMESFIDTQVL